MRLDQLFERAFSYFVGPVVLGDLFSDDDYVIVSFEFIDHRVFEGLAIGDFWHGRSS